MIKIFYTLYVDDYDTAIVNMNMIDRGPFDPHDPHLLCQTWIYIVIFSFAST